MRPGVPPAASDPRCFRGGRLCGRLLRLGQCRELERAGVPAGTVGNRPAAARAAGLHVASADGFFVLGEPELAFEIHTGTLTAFAGAAVQRGIAAETIDSLRAGNAGGYE